MTDVIANLPAHLQGSTAREMWEVFAAVSAIPRASGQEGPVREYLKRRAASRGWDVQEDAVGNVVFRVTGTGALRDAEPLILQGHMDMVCEKEIGGTHDFSRDPLRLRCQGEWIDAAGTTLGADNGIAIAMATAAAEAPAARRCPLELLWTVDEETGLTGAMELDAAMLRGRRMINLDSESEGVFIIGCAGGLDLAVRFESRGGKVSSPAVTFRLTGFRGGHSGINIHEGRGNAIRAAAELLQELRRFSPDVVLLHFAGGTKKNAIPRDAEFTVAGVSREDAAGRLAHKMKEFAAVEPRASLEAGAAAAPAAIPLPWEAVDFITEIPNGVVAMDPELTDLVRTSTNIGVAVTEEGGIGLRFHIRSSVDTDRDETGRRITAAAARLGGVGTFGAAYPGWEPHPHSDLLKKLEGTWRRVHGAAPKVTAIHAGLEAGVIGALLGSDEMASFGPTIENAHSPGERLHVASAERTYRFLREVITSA